MGTPGERRYRYCVVQKGTGYFVLDDETGDEVYAGTDQAAATRQCGEMEGKMQTEGRNKAIGCGGCTGGGVRNLGVSLDPDLLSKLQSGTAADGTPGGDANRMQLMIECMAEQCGRYEAENAKLRNKLAAKPKRKRKKAGGGNGTGS